NDSIVLDYRWRYARKDGGPDRRFSNNRRIPVVQYGCLELSFRIGLNLQIYVSNPLRAGEFAIALLSYSDHHLKARAQGASTASSKQSSTSANSQYRTQTKFHQANNYGEAPTGKEQPKYDRAKW